MAGPVGRAAGVASVMTASPWTARAWPVAGAGQAVPAATAPVRALTATVVLVVWVVKAVPAVQVAMLAAPVPSAVAVPRVGPEVAAAQVALRAPGAPGAPLVSAVAAVRAAPVVRVVRVGPALTAARRSAPTVAMVVRAVPVARVGLAVRAALVQHQGRLAKAAAAA